MEDAAATFKSPAISCENVLLFEFVEFTACRLNNFQ